MSLAASRAAIRQSTFAVRRAGIRNASTTAEATNTVKETASKAQSKASEGLTKVTSSASSAAQSAGQAANNATQQATGRVGRMVNFVNGQSHHHCGGGGYQLAMCELRAVVSAERANCGVHWLVRTALHGLSGAAIFAWLTRDRRMSTSRRTAENSKLNYRLTVLQDWFPRLPTTEGSDSSSASLLPTNEACNHRKPPSSTTRHTGVSE